MLFITTIHTEQLYIKYLGLAPTNHHALCHNRLCLGTLVKHFQENLQFIFI